MQTLESEVVTFAGSFIDCTFARENKSTRKRTPTSCKYLTGDYDLRIVGDRETDVQLAKIWARKRFSLKLNFAAPEDDETISVIAADWREIYEF